MRYHTAETQATVTPEKAIQFLKEGNERFVKNLKMNRNLLEQANVYKDGQYPFAAILSCMDSRTSAELIFDQGLGDIFSIRVAGNILNDDIIGSMEYACKFAGAKLLLVLGHSKCGAVGGACAQKKAGLLTQLLHKLDVSVAKVRYDHPDLNANDPLFVDAVAQHNVIHSMNEIFKKSEILRDMFEKGEIAVAGAYYDLDSGKVEFLKEFLKSKETDELLKAG